MLKQIKKYYRIQLLVCFIAAVVLINISGLTERIDEFSAGRLFLLSLVAASIFLIGNALVNSLNFTYPKRKSDAIAFDIPIGFWLILAMLSAHEVYESNGLKFLDWGMLLLMSQPIVYNYLLKKRIMTYELTVE